MINIEIKGLNEWNISFQNYIRNIPKFGRRGCWLFVNNLAVMLRAQAPRGVTGYLRSERGTYVKGTQTSDEWELKMPYYVKELEKGTPIGTRIQRTAKAELWARKKMGRSFNFFRNSIIKYGTKPHPFTERVIRESILNLKETINKQVRRGIKVSKR